jgi:transcriptional regulator with XRE-family HTH domain
MGCGVSNNDNMKECFIMARPTTRTEKEVYHIVKFHDSPICKRVNELINESNRKDFCKVIGVTERTVYHWRKGQSRPDIDRLGDIADYFGVTTDYLTGRIDEKTLAWLMTASIEPNTINRLVVAASKLNDQGLEKSLEYMSDLQGNSNYQG